MPSPCTSGSTAMISRSAVRAPSGAGSPSTVVANPTTRPSRSATTVVAGCFSHAPRTSAAWLRRQSG